MGFLSTITIILGVLKLTGLLAISWLLVLAPTLIALGVSLGLLLIFGTLAYLAQRGK